MVIILLPFGVEPAYETVDTKFNLLTQVGTALAQNTLTESMQYNVYR